jgi:hypothetical protein
MIQAAFVMIETRSSIVSFSTTFLAPDLYATPLDNAEECPRVSSRRRECA